MSKTKWYARPIRRCELKLRAKRRGSVAILLALALVLSLGITALPMAGTVEAQDTFNNPGYTFQMLTNNTTGEAGEKVCNPSFSPDGTRVVYMKGIYNGTAQIWVMKSDGSEKQRIDNGSGYEGVPFWSSDGERIIWEGGADGDRSAMAVDVTITDGNYSYSEPYVFFHLSLEEYATLGIENVDTGGYNCCNPSWFPGSDKIVFWVFFTNNQADLFAYEKSTDTLARITDTPDYSDYEPKVSPDGAKIIYWSGETSTEPGPNVHIIPTTGWPITTAGTLIAEQASWPTYNRDGTTIAFSHHYGTGYTGNRDIYIADAAGNFKFSLTNMGDGHGNMGYGGEWGPNGEFVFTSYLSGYRNIWLATPKTSDYVYVHGIGYFATIQEAIDAAQADDTIIVAAGTYNERLTINKSLDLQGAQYGVDPTPAGARTTPADESIIDIAGLSPLNPNVAVEIPNGVSDVTVAGFTLIGIPTPNVADDSVIRCGGSSGTNNDIAISNNIIDGYLSILFKSGDGLTVQQNDITFNKNAIVIQSGCTNVGISDNTMTGGTNMADDPYAIYITSTTGSITGNTIENVIGPDDRGKGIAGSNNHHLLIDDNVINNTGYDGISFWSNTHHVTISNNTLSNNAQTYTKGGGITIKGDDLTIIYNDITGSGHDGVIIDKDVLDSVRIDINYNNIWGNADYGVNVKDAGEIVDATNNWWGNASGPYHVTTNPSGTGDPVSDNVHYSTWCAIEDTDLVIPGYQAPTPMVWGVSTDGTIQHAIDDAQPNDTINVAAGTYHESAQSWVDIDIYKSLSLIGAGSSLTVVELNDGVMDGVIIGASDVLIQGIKFTKKPGAPYACGFNIRSSGDYSNITLRDVESEYSYGMNVCFEGSVTFQNVTLEDCNIHHGGERNFYQSPSTTINGLTVTNCHFDWAGQQPGGDPIGFNLQGTTTDLTITGGTFNHNVNDGINIGQVSGATIEDVTVISSASGVGDRSGIAIWDVGVGTSNVEIINPTVTNCGGRGIMFGTWGQTVSNVSVTGGTVSGSGNNGVMVYAGGEGASVSDITLGGVTITGSGSRNVCICEDDSSGNATVSGVVIEGCPITKAVSNGVFFDGVADVTGSRVNFNNITENDMGVVNTAGMLDATNNWWGANDGPDDDAGVINGSGDKISANVDAAPWIQFTLDADPAQIVADGTSQSDLTAKLKNSDDTIVASDTQLNQLPDFAKVTFTTDKGSVGSLETTKDMTDGQATATLTSSTTVETATIEAQAKDASEVAISGATDSTTVKFIAGLVDRIVTSPDTATITAGATQAYTAEAFDLYGNSLDDVTATTTWDIAAGAGGSWAANVYTSENVGTWTVTGTYNDKSDIATLIVNPAALHTVTLTADPTNIPADGTSTSIITAIVKDQYGNPVVDGTEVTFTTDHGTLSSTTATTTSGEASVTLTSESSTETVIATVTATANDVSDAAAVFFIAEGGAEAEESRIGIVSDSGTIEDTATGGDVTIDATGDHIITTAKYEDNPGGIPTFEATGDYYDVHLDDDTGVNSLTIEFCPADEDTIIYYWDGTSWRRASNQSYSGGCIVVTITGDTFPSLSDLSGLPFASGTPYPPPPVGGEAYPVNKLGILAPWIALVAAIIAGSTIFMRRRRAEG